ncbi:hypothetical protein EW146_g484 [Bondarzewia mesenterica]|uniref:Core domain-containing protein n=1 Tax=Bondarzewia mesenterica TaxID=1095465 RepID=A0A4S4M8E0_9AGAM|nr:hypothetical protein EW146_g484 [Bondarzewia mesenterica]
MASFARIHRVQRLAHHFHPSLMRAPPSRRAMMSAWSGRDAPLPIRPSAIPEPPLHDSPPVVVPSTNTPLCADAASPQIAARPPPAPRAERPKPKLRPRTAALTITPAAVERLRILTRSPTPQLIRIGVRNKGCAGLSYHLEYVDRPAKFDEIVEQDNVRVLIDSKALFSIIGSEMDWKEDALSSKFVFKNPNIKDAYLNDNSFHVVIFIFGYDVHFGFDLRDISQESAVLGRLDSAQQHLQSQTWPENVKKSVPRTSQQMNSSIHCDFRPIGYKVHALFNEHYAKRDAAILQKLRDEYTSLRAQYDASQVENQRLHAEIALLREQNMEVTEHAMHADLLLQQASTDHASIFEPAGSPVQTVSDGMQTPPPSLPAECSNQEVNLNTAALVPPPATIMDSSGVTIQVPDSTILSTASSSELEENSDSEITDHSDSSGEESGSDNELTPHTIRYVPDNGGIFYIDRHTEPRRRVGRPLKRPRLLNEAPATRADSISLAHNASEPLSRMMGAPAMIGGGGLGKGKGRHPN